MEFSNNYSSLKVMSTLPYLDYFFCLSMETAMKCESVQGMHMLYREYK
jgi:hypothetical protein